jgi:pimeloyl-ACP methyl ester carboxylesterase
MAGRAAMGLPAGAERAVRLTRVKLARDDAGRGECVVLIHGHPFDRTLWSPQRAALRSEFRVVAPDLRGFGESPVTAHAPGGPTLGRLTVSAGRYRQPESG